MINKSKKEETPISSHEHDIKMKLFMLAVENGELDHLDKDQSFKARYLRKLHRLTDEMLKKETAGDTEAQQMQSIISMVYTLMLECETTKLYDVINENFPEYYIKSLA